MNSSTDLSRRTVLKGAGAPAAGALAGRPVGAQSESDSPDPEAIEVFVDELVAEGLAEHDVAGALFLGFAVGLGALVAVDPNTILFEASPALLGLLVLPVLGAVTTLGTLVCCVLA